jgi:hypothetical protein
MTAATEPLDSATNFTRGGIIVSRIDGDVGSSGRKGESGCGSDAPGTPRDQANTTFEFHEV